MSQMEYEGQNAFGKIRSKIKDSFIGKHFYNKQFFHYTWIGVFISALNVFLLWFFIDVLDIPTVISSIIVIGATFIIRYILYIFSKIV